MKRDLNTKTLTVALLLSIVAIGTMNARREPVTRTQMAKTRATANKKLFQAVREGDTRKITDLIKKEGANVNAMSAKGTPLIVAAKKAAKPKMDSKMAKVVRTLLGNDANASLKGPGNMTALMLAAQGGADDTVKALLKNKEARKTINMKNLQGNDALGYASQKGNKKITKLLLSYKEIRPTKKAAMQAKTEKIRDMIQEKRDKLVKAGKLEAKPIKQGLVRPVVVRPGVVRPARRAARRTVYRRN